MFKLDSRLMACAEFINSESIVDVGTDHAKLPIWLVKNKIIKFAYACDINKFSLEKSKKNIQKYDLDKKIEVFYSNGLSNVSENIAETIVIAGLGGETIKNILKSCTWNEKDKKNKKFILQPTKYDHILRDFLSKNNFEIVKEKVVNQNKYNYTTMLCKFSVKNYKFNSLYNFLGKIPANKNSIEYVKKNIRYLEKFLFGAKMNKNIQYQNKIEDIILGLKKFIRICEENIDQNT